MPSRWARAGLVLLSTLAAVWLAAGLRSARLADEGTTVLAATAVSFCPPPEIRRGERLLDRARRLGPDAALLVRQGRALLEGCPESAVAPFAQAVRLEPESFEAWAGLALALRGTDSARASRAQRRAVELDPQFAEALERLR